MLKLTSYLTMEQEFKIRKGKAACVINLFNIQYCKQSRYLLDSYSPPRHPEKRKEKKKEVGNTQGRK